MSRCCRPAGWRDRDRRARTRLPPPRRAQATGSQDEWHAWSVAEDRPPLVGGSAEQRRADRSWKKVVEIDVELHHPADAGAALAVDRHDRLHGDLEGVAD